MIFPTEISVELVKHWFICSFKRSCLSPMKQYHPCIAPQVIIIASNCKRVKEHQRITDLATQRQLLWWRGRGRALTVHPAVAAVLPVLQFMLAKPQVDLLLGAFHRVAAVNHVPATRRKQKIEQVSWRFIMEMIRGVSCITLDLSRQKHEISSHWWSCLKISFYLQYATKCWAIKHLSCMLLQWRD